MKKISLRGLSEILSEKELKNVMGGSGAFAACSSSDSCTGIHMCWTQAGGDGYCKRDSSNNCKCL
ncbi:MAG: TIGR04149 family rSAM-modified RiPP [Dysgonamonadaceae bacterium]|nr:TIGR04149 family rSAM-modified RiPP [Dysgonamonadaceae bacterium]